MIEIEVRLSEWADWRLCGSGGIGYPREVAFMRAAGGDNGHRDYTPDCDKALRCGAVQAAVDAVGGIHQGIIETVYLYPRGVDRATSRYGIHRATVYRWLDNARHLVGEELVRQEEKRSAKVA